MKYASIHLDVTALRALLGLDPSVSILHIDWSPVTFDRLEMLVEGDALPDVFTCDEHAPVLAAEVVFRSPLPGAELRPRVPPVSSKEPR